MTSCPSTEPRLKASPAVRAINGVRPRRCDTMQVTAVCKIVVVQFTTVIARLIYQREIWRSSARLSQRIIFPKVLRTLSLFGSSPTSLYIISGHENSYLLQSSRSLCLSMKLLAMLVLCWLMKIMRLMKSWTPVFLMIFKELSLRTFSSVIFIIWMRVALTGWCSASYSEYLANGISCVAICISRPILPGIY